MAPDFNLPTTEKAEKRIELRRRIQTEWMDRKTILLGTKYPCIKEAYQWWLNINTYYWLRFGLANAINNYIRIIAY